MTEIKGKIADCAQMMRRSDNQTTDCIEASQECPKTNQ
jgi:hypothetical protein